MFHGYPKVWQGRIAMDAPHSRGGAYERPLTQPGGATRADERRMLFSLAGPVASGPGFLRSRLKDGDRSSQDDGGFDQSLLPWRRGPNGRPEGGGSLPPQDHVSMAAGYGSSGFRPSNEATGCRGREHAGGHAAGVSVNLSDCPAPNLVRRAPRSQRPVQVGQAFSWVSLGLRIFIVAFPG